MDHPLVMQVSLFDPQWRERNKVYFLKLLDKTWGFNGHTEQ